MQQSPLPDNGWLNYFRGPASRARDAVGGSLLCMSTVRVPSSVFVRNCWNPRGRGQKHGLAIMSNLKQLFYEENPLRGGVQGPRAGRFRRFIPRRESRDALVEELFGTAPSVMLLGSGFMRISEQGLNLSARSEVPRKPRWDLFPCFAFHADANEIVSLLLIQRPHACI